jgi:hypothetical protein
MYLELAEQFITTARGFDATGHLRPLQTLRDDGTPVATRLYDASTRLYGEVGLATRLALVTQLTVLRAIATPRAGETARDAAGIGDLLAGFRLQLLDEEVSCALDARLGIPTGAADAPQPLGTGDLRGEVMLSVGRMGERLPIFFVIELGARLRASGTQRAQAAGRAAPGTDPLSPLTPGERVEIDYASEILYGGELGYVVRAGERLRITSRIALDGRHGLTAPASLPIDPVAPSSVRLVRLGASLSIGAVLGRRRPTAGQAMTQPMTQPITQPITQIDVRLGGGGFVWGEGIPAAGELSLALGVSR